MTPIRCKRLECIIVDPVKHCFLAYPADSSNLPNAKGLLVSYATDTVTLCDVLLVLLNQDTICLHYSQVQIPSSVGIFNITYFSKEVLFCKRRFAHQSRNKRSKLFLSF